GREAAVPSARLRRGGRADGLPRARPLRDPAPQDDRPARGVPQRLNVSSHRLLFNEVGMRPFALPIVCSVLGALLVAAAPRPLEELRGFSARAARDERVWGAPATASPAPRNSTGTAPAATPTPRAGTAPGPSVSGTTAFPGTTSSSRPWGSPSRARS